MADYSDFTSMGTTYEFSKGPKSLYYAKGDEDLFAVVLNVPQTDDDDEWGGTERIALERTADAIGSLQAIVGSQTEPSGYGIGNGLIQEMSAVKGIVHTDVPEVEVGNVVISGASDSITIGSDATLDGDTLTLGGSGEFSIDRVDANRYKIAYKSTFIRFLDSGGMYSITLGVGPTAVYVFDETSLTVPGITVSGDLTIAGDIGATNGVFSGDIAADEITAATINATALVAGTATICGDLSTRNVAPDINITRNIGTPANRYLGIAAVNLNLSGDIVADEITASTVNATALVAGAATICGALSTMNIAPDVALTRNIGTPGNRYLGIAGVNLDLSGNASIGGYASVTGDIYSVAWTDYSTSSTVAGWTSIPPATTKIYYKKVGKIGIVEFLLSGSDGLAMPTTFTLPASMAAKNVASLPIYAPIRFVNSATPSTTPGIARMDPGATTVQLYIDWAMLSPWGAGSKLVAGTLVYETDV